MVKGPKVRDQKSKGRGQGSKVGVGQVGSGVKGGWGKGLKECLSGSLEMSGWASLRESLHGN